MKVKIKNALLNPISMFILGLISGVVVKEIDIHFYAQHFGFSLSEIFSEIGIWVVIGVVISLYSRNTKYAMLNTFTYCIGMIIAYYITAELTDSVYGWAYIKMWAVFACLSPVMAYLVTLTKNPGVLAFVIKIGIFAGYIVINLFLGAFIKIYDILFFAVLIYLLFFQKHQKNAGKRHQDDMKPMP